MLDTIVYMVYYYNMSNTQQTEGGMMKQVSTANGKAAWKAAEKTGKPMNPAFFRYNGKLIAHSGATYIEGEKPGDYGFCTDAARNAYDHGGVWLDTEGK